MTLRRSLHLTAAATALLALGACGQVDTVRTVALGFFAGPGMPEVEPLQAPLDAAVRPRAPLQSDMRVRSLLDGSLRTFDVSHNGDAVRVRQSDGCVWTRWGDWFAPSDSWANCGDSDAWATGRATVRANGSLWPLREGSHANWTRRAVSANGRSYERETRCEVTGAEAVIRQGRAPTPAHVVRCSDDKRVRTTWFSPDEGPVAFRQVHSAKGVEDAWVKL